MKNLALGILVAIVMAFVGGAVANASSDKWLVWHKGDAICVDDDSVDAHYNHGGPWPTENCD